MSDTLRSLFSGEKEKPTKKDKVKRLEHEIELLKDELQVERAERASERLLKEEAVRAHHHLLHIALTQER